MQDGKMCDQIRLFASKVNPECNARQRVMSRVCRLLHGSICTKRRLFGTGKLYYITTL